MAVLAELKADALTIAPGPRTSRIKPPAPPPPSRPCSSSSPRHSRPPCSAAFATMPWAIYLRMNSSDLLKERRPPSRVGGIVWISWCGRGGLCSLR